MNITPFPHHNLTELITPAICIGRRQVLVEDFGTRARPKSATVPVSQYMFAVFSPR